MPEEKIASLAGLAIAGVLVLAVGSLIMASTAFIGGEWIAGGLCLIAASITFSTIFYVLFK